VLLRVTERRDWAREFAALPIISSGAGTVLRLDDIASVEDDFEDVDRFATYDGKPSIGIGIFRVGDQTPIAVSAAVRRVMAEVEGDLPPGVDYAIQDDRSEIYEQRLDLLVRNAALGLVLVLACLSLFLELRLAFWVTLGIPTSFLGSLLFLPALGVSINMMSLFAFIIALGIVVDDAIVVGENVYEYRQRGTDAVGSAIRGARDVTAPVGFSILTNIVAFLPLMFVPGVMGKIWGVIPLVVSTVFLLSWMEALFVLPAHLAHVGPRRRRGWSAALHRWQQRFSHGFSSFVGRVYGRFIDAALRARYLTVAVAAATLAVVLAYAWSSTSCSPSRSPATASRRSS
jgi:multidrug efflux pump subunit AcrB